MSAKILITDDHDEFRAIVKSYLAESDQQFQIHEASSGESGVVLAIKERPDIVLMDIRLPGITGLDAAKQIKKKVPDCKIIFLTMFETQAFREAFSSEDVDAYIGKSELYESLLPLIKKILKGA